MARVFVKICGVRDLATARVAAGAGADAIGFVHHPASPRHLEAAGIRPIVEALGDVETVLVVRGLPLDQVLSVAHAGGVSTVQFHGGEPDSDLLRAQAEGFRVIRALPPKAYPRASTMIDVRVLLDAPEPGQGQLIEADQFTQKPDEPWILAGGLNPGNVRAQIEHLHPDGVDVSSGVESSRGVKDHARIVSFIENARAAE